MQNQLILVNKTDLVARRREKESVSESAGNKKILSGDEGRRSKAGRSQNGDKDFRKRGKLYKTEKGFINFV